MPTLQEVEQQLKSLDGWSKWLGKREMQALPSILWPDEKIEGGIQGLYNSRQGMLISTDRRLIFVEKSMLGRLTVEDFPYDKITSIQYETGWALGSVKIYASGNRADITHIAKDQVQPFAESVRARISGGGTAQAGTVAASVGDLLPQLERLATLKNAGALTDEEFAAAKAKLLGSA